MIEENGGKSEKEFKNIIFQLHIILVNKWTDICLSVQAKNTTKENDDNEQQ